MEKMTSSILSGGILIITSLCAVNISHADNTAEDGMIRLKSAYTVTQTLNRLETVLSDKGMTIFKRVSHSDGARKAGLDLRDTELIIFGNPKVGTALMQCAQSVAIDLPQKALAYKDKDGQVWLAYNDPAYLRKRHDIGGCGAAIEKISGALSNIMQSSMQP